MIDIDNDHFYLDPLYTLPITIEFDFNIWEDKTEVIPVFSQNMKGWGQGGDGLSFYAAPHRKDFTIRTELFNLIDIDY